MVPQQTISKDLRNGLDVLEKEVKEMIVIPFLNEDILTVVAAVVDVIVGIETQRGRACHVRSFG